MESTKGAVKAASQRRVAALRPTQAAHAATTTLEPIYAISLPRAAAIWCAGHTITVERQLLAQWRVNRVPAPVAKPRRARCQGSECSYLHCIPGDVFDARLDTAKDSFGRTRHGTDSDNMGGVGNFSRERCARQREAAVDRHTRT